MYIAEICSLCRRSTGRSTYFNVIRFIVIFRVPRQHFALMLVETRGHQRTPHTTTHPATKEKAASSRTGPMLVAVAVQRSWLLSFCSAFFPLDSNGVLSCSRNRRLTGSASVLPACCCVAVFCCCACLSRFCSSGSSSRSST